MSGIAFAIEGEGDSPRSPCLRPFDDIASDALDGLTVLAGVLLAILGPFGSYMNGGPLRLLAYWTGAVLLGLALYKSAYRLVGMGRHKAPADGG